MEVAYVNLWKERVGAVLWNPTTRLASFEYEPRFTNLGLDISPITMPIERSDTIFSFPELSNIVKTLRSGLRHSPPRHRG